MYSVLYSCFFYFYFIKLNWALYLYLWTVLRHTWLLSTSATQNYFMIHLYSSLFPQKHNIQTIPLSFVRHWVICKRFLLHFENIWFSRASTLPAKTYWKETAQCSGCQPISSQWYLFTLRTFAISSTLVSALSALAAQFESN